MNINIPGSLNPYPNDDRVANTCASDTGGNQVRGISVVAPGDVAAKCGAYPALQGMPEELLYNIFSRLALRDISIIKSTFDAADRVGNELLSQKSKCWFSRFTPQQQAKFRKIAGETDEHSLRIWLGQLTKEETVVNHLIKNLSDRHFPELLFYTANQLMSNCPLFKVEKKVTIAHSGSIEQATLSVDNNHLVTGSWDKTAKIYGLVAGEWIKKATINHSDRICSAVFSSDCLHVATCSANELVKIYDQLRDGSWTEALITKNGDVQIANFSTDGSHVVVTRSDFTVEIFSWVKGNWEKKGSIAHELKPYQATFIGDSSHVAIGILCHQIIYAQSESGSWQQVIDISSKPNFLATFSADGSHLIIAGENNTAKILVRDTDGKWRKEGNFTISQHLILNITFNPDGSRVALPSYEDSNVKIYVRADSGKWTEEYTITHCGIPRSVVFSPDGRHLVTASNDGTSKIFSLSRDGKWTEKATITFDHYVINATFSPDASHVLACGGDGKAKIYGLDTKGNWREKAIISHGLWVNAAFSADGRYVITASSGKRALEDGINSTAILWALCSPTVNADSSSNRMKKGEGFNADRNSFFSGVVPDGESAGVAESADTRRHICRSCLTR